MSEMLKMKDLGYHSPGFAILLPASIFGLHLVFPARVQADQDLAAQGHRPNNDSKFFKKVFGVPL